MKTALSLPYTDIIGSRAANFKRSLLPVDVSICLSVFVCSVCLFATLMLNISETKRFRVSCPIGSLQESAYNASNSDAIDDVSDSMTSYS